MARDPLRTRVLAGLLGVRPQPAPLAVGPEQSYGLGRRVLAGLLGVELGRTAQPVAPPTVREPEVPPRPRRGPVRRASSDAGPFSMFQTGPPPLPYSTGAAPAAAPAQARSAEAEPYGAPFPGRPGHIPLPEWGDQLTVAARQLGMAEGWLRLFGRSYILRLFRSIAGVRTTIDRAVRVERGLTSREREVSFAVGLPGRAALVLGEEVADSLVELATRFAECSAVLRPDLDIPRRRCERQAEEIRAAVEAVRAVEAEGPEGRHERWARLLRAVVAPYDDLRTAEAAVHAAAHEFQGADLSGTQLQHIDLTEIRWDAETLWPSAEWAARMRAASTEDPRREGVFVVRAAGGTDEGAEHVPTPQGPRR